MLSGLGLAAPLQWLDYNKSIGFVQNRILYDVAHKNIKLVNDAMKANYGEILDIDYILHKVGVIFVRVILL